MPDLLPWTQVGNCFSIMDWAVPDHLGGWQYCLMDWGGRDEYCLMDWGDLLCLPHGLRKVDMTHGLRKVDMTHGPRKVDMTHGLRKVDMAHGLRKVDMKTAVSMLRVACHHPSGKKIASPGRIVHSCRCTWIVQFTPVLYSYTCTVQCTPVLYRCSVVYMCTLFYTCVQCTIQVLTVYYTVYRCTLYLTDVQCIEQLYTLLYRFTVYTKLNKIPHTGDTNSLTTAKHDLGRGWARGRGRADQWEASNWSCDHRANERKCYQ